MTYETHMTALEYLQLKRPPKISKYRNKPTDIEGIQFDSRKEAKRWQDLSILQADGQIKKLQRQVTFPLIVNGQLICKYRADFQYEENGERVTEDVKGLRTDVYKIKAKLMKACLNISIRET